MTPDSNHCLRNRSTGHGEAFGPREPTRKRNACGARSDGQHRSTISESTVDHEEDDATNRS
jgi:hypothetical protein